MQKTELSNPPVEMRTAEAEGPPAKKSKTEDESVTKEKTTEGNTQFIKEPSSAVEEQAMDQSLPEDIKTNTMDEQTEETTAEASKQMEEHPGVDSDSDEEKGG